MILEDRIFKSEVGKEVFYCGHPVKILADLNNGEYVVEILSHVFHQDSGDPYEPPYSEPIYTSLVVPGKYLSESKMGIEDWLKEKIANKAEQIKALDNEIISKRRNVRTFEQEVKKLTDKYAKTIEEVEMFYMLLTSDLEYIVLKDDSYYNEKIFLYTKEEFFETFKDYDIEYEQPAAFELKHKVGKTQGLTISLTKDGSHKGVIVGAYNDKQQAIECVKTVLEKTDFSRRPDIKFYEWFKATHGITIGKWEEYAETFKKTLITKLEEGRIRIKKEIEHQTKCLKDIEEQLKGENV